MIKVIFLVVIGLATSSCSNEGENHPCYDSTLVHDGPCLTHCPGFKGCDGKTYCNECEAARYGIGPK